MGLLNFLFGNGEQDSGEERGYGDLTEQELSLLDEAEEAQQAELDGEDIREPIRGYYDRNTGRGALTVEEGSDRWEVYGQSTYHVEFASDDEFLGDLLSQ